MTVNLLTEDLDESMIPEKFMDPKTKAVRVQAILDSYNALERKMSQTPSAPKSPEEFCIDCSHGLFQPDMEVNKRLHAKGFSHEQAQEVYDLAAERMIPMIMDMAAEFHADREVEKLVGHYGGPERWQEISRQLLAFGQKNLPPDVLGNLSSSFEGVLALERMMKSNEPSLQRGSDNVPTGMDEKELNSMMRDPRYWRDRDPAFVAKVTEGFQKMFGGK
ncbi:MAG TPA: hypothetical protein DEA55_04135 [Rhodospirillaceae bacterium]|nr:hypothetical protein [Rhodospirillaceae bacterium]